MEYLLLVRVENVSLASTGQQKQDSALKK